MAGKAAPVVAALGLLAAGPHVYADVSGGPARGTGPAVAPSPALPSAPGDLLALFKSRAYRAHGIQTARRHAGPATARRSARVGASAHRRAAAVSGRRAAVRCSGSGGMVPAHYARIVGFLTAHGYTGNAAAGIAGNIYQESMGNPESVGSGGGGLIGWTPLPSGFVTGDPQADLRTQLAAILAFNRQWAQYIPSLNAAATPAQAADIYVTDFERAGVPAAANREAAAAAVAAACGIKSAR